MPEIVPLYLKLKNNILKILVSLPKKKESKEKSTPTVPLPPYYPYTEIS